MMRCPDTLDPGRVIAHRGASGDAPENTLAAFREAARQGARWVEFDAALLADGEVVIHHDATIDRCTDGSGRVYQKTWPEIRNLDAGSWFAPAFAGERLATLDNALDEISRLGLFANLEIKVNEGESEASAKASAGRLSARPDLLGRILVTSFDHGALAVFRSQMPEVPIGLLYDKPRADWVEVAQRLGASSLHISHKHLDRPLMDTAAKAGITVRVWTANRREDVAPFWPQRLDGVITNYPALFLADGEDR